MSKRHSNVALSGLVLAGVGYLAGVLTAPKSGRETRRDIQNTLLKTKTEAEKSLKGMHRELNTLLEEVASTSKQATAKTKAEIKKALDTGTAAKDKAKDVLSAIHEGESEDKDLQKALDEAQKAITHLKKYARKDVQAKKRK